MLDPFAKALTQASQSKESRMTNLSGRSARFTWGNLFLAVLIFALGIQSAWAQDSSKEKPLSLSHLMRGKLTPKNEALLCQENWLPLRERIAADFGA